MLLSVSAIVSQTWDVFRRHTRYFILYMVWTFLAVFALKFMQDVLLNTSFVSRQGTAFVVFSLFTILIAVITLWFHLALMAAAKRAIDNQPVEPFKIALKRVMPFLAATIGVALLSLVYVGVGALLLVIPGIICAVWYAFASCNVLFQGQGVVEAMAASKRLVVGRWWGVAWRLIVPTGIIVFISMVIQILVMAPFTWPFVFNPTITFQVATINAFVVAMLNAFVFPMITIALLIVYFDLVAHPVELAPVPQPKITLK